MTSENLRRTAVLALSGVAALSGGGAAAYLLAERMQLFFYPALAVLLASVAYLVSEIIGELNYDAGLAWLPDARVLDSAIFLGVLALVVLSRVTPFGLSRAYYWTIPAIALLFVVRILERPSRLTFYQLVLFAVVLRASIWFSAPVVGADVRVHVALVEFVAASGRIPPNSVSYYYWYPVAHVSAGVLSQLPTVSAKQAFFLTTGLFSCLGVVGTYLFTSVALRNVFDRDDCVRGALIAALVIAVAPWHLRRSGLLIAQSMGLAAFPFALYAAVRFRQYQYVVLFVVCTALIAFSHNLTPILLAVVLFVLLVSDRLVSVLGRYVPDWRTMDVEYGFPLVFATGIVTVQYWILIEYFDLQVLRVVLLLSTDTSLSESTSDSTLSSSNAFTLADPFLHVGVEQVVFGTAVILFTFVVLGRKRTDVVDTPMAVFLTASIVFSVFSTTLLLGEWTRVIRVLPTVVLVVAPAFGFFVCTSYDSESFVAVVLVALLLALPLSGAIAATVGTVNPAISPTESGGAKQYLTEPDLAAGDHVVQHGNQSATFLADGYVSGTINYRTAGRRGAIPDSRTAFSHALMNTPIYVESDETANRSERISSLRAEPNRFFVNVNGFESTLDPTPAFCSVVYDNGGSEVVTC